MRCANSNTESMRSFALPAGIAEMVSLLMTSPLRQTKLWNMGNILFSVQHNHE